MSQHNKDWWKLYREKNRTRLNEYKKKWYHENNLKDERRREYNENPEKHRDYRMQRYKTIRNRIIYVLGGKCSRCSFSDWRALQVDHVNGNGNVERRTRGHAASTLYRRIQDSIDNKLGLFQLLCANCNWIKRYENKEMMMRFK